MPLDMISEDALEQYMLLLSVSSIHTPSILFWTNSNATALLVVQSQHV